MKLLLDESLPKRLGSLLPDHEVSTAALEGWAGISNGKLLALASNKFEAFIGTEIAIGIAWTAAMFVRNSSRANGRECSMAGL